MGFRLYINHKNKEYGGDHKLYGYHDVKDLTSFPILIPEIRSQWDIPITYSGEYIYLLYFCNNGITDDLVLDEVMFSVFAKRYCLDLKNVYSNDPYVSHITGYMEELINSPGEKVLSWY